VPVLRMLTLAPDELAARAARLRQAILAALPAGQPQPELLPGESTPGGGSFPGAALPTTLVAVHPAALGAAGLALRLRLGSPPVVARVQEDRVVLDPRTLPPDSLEMVGAAVARALAEE